MERLTQHNQDQAQPRNQWEEIELRREQAMTDYISGYTDTINQSTEPFDPTSQDLSSNQQTLAKLNLLNADLTQSDTYTNYIAMGGAPQENHDSLIFMDRRNEYQKRLNEGTLTEEQYLKDLYAVDILEANGYNVRSVGWWQNKFHSNDFTTPYENEYLMSNILEEARQYDTQLAAKEYAQTQSIKNSKLSHFVGKELEAQDVKDLFPTLSEYVNDSDLTDKEFMNQLLSGAIQAHSRISWIDPGKDGYYLHTDGQLYRLSNTEEGDNVARFTLDNDGNLKEISLNYNTLHDVGRSFLSGASSLVTGFLKLGTLLTATRAVFDNKQTYFDLLASDLNALDAAINDFEVTNWITDSGRVDMDGFQWDDAKDWGNTIAYVSGMIVGGKAIGKLASIGVNKAASLATAASRTTGLKSLALKTASTTLKTTSNLWARSTGMYQGFGDDLLSTYTIFGRPVYQGTAAAFYNHATKTVPVYWVKDYYSTVQQLNNQKINLMMQGDIDPALLPSSEDISNRAMLLSTLNAGISTIFAGGINDNQVQRLKGFYQHQGQWSWKATVDAVVDDDTLKKVFTSSNTTIGLNTAFDFLDNFLTLSSTDVMGNIDKETGEFTSEFDVNFIAKNAVQALIMTSPTLKGQVEGRNLAFEQLSNSHKAILDGLETSIQKEAGKADGGKSQAISNIRDIYIDDFNTHKGTVEEKILYAMNNLHKNTKDNNGNSLVTDKIEAITRPVVIATYKAMVEDAKNYLKEYNAKQVENLDNIENKGTRGAMIQAVLYKAALGNPKEYQLNIERSRNNAAELTAHYMLQYNVLTDSKESTDMFERYTNNEKLFSTTVRTTSTYDNLNKKLKEKVDAKLSEIADSKPELDIDDIKSNSTFIIMKNELSGEDREKMYANKAAAINVTRYFEDLGMSRVDDDIFMFTGVGSEVQKLFTKDTYSKVVLASKMIQNNQTEDAVKLYLSTMLGGTEYKKALRGQANVSNIKTLLYTYLNDLVNNHAITELQATRFMIELSKQESDISEIVKNVLKGTEVNHKNVSVEKQDELEAYMLRYNALKLIQKDNKKFSSSSVQEARNLILTKDNKPDLLTNKVMKDMVEVGELSEKAIEKYNEIIQETSDDQVPLTTNNVTRIVSKFTEDIKGNLKTLLDNKTELDAYLESIYGGLTDNTKFLEDFKATVTEQLKFLAEFEETKLNDNIVVLDTTRISNEALEKMKSLVRSTDTEAGQSMLEKGSLPKDYKFIQGINEYLELSKSLASAGIPFYVLDLNKPTDVDFLVSLNSVVDICNFGDFNSADTIKEALKAGNINEHAEAFLKYNIGTDYVTDITKGFENKIVEAIKKEQDFKIKLDSEVKIINRSTGDIQNIDVATVISNMLSPEYVSNAMSQRARRTNKKLIINPFVLTKELLNNKDIINKIGLGTKGKTGRIASLLADVTKAINTKGDFVEVNKDLSTTFMLMDMVKSIVDGKSEYVAQIKVSHNSKGKLIDKLSKLGIIGDDAFYEVDPVTAGNKTNFITIRLKDNVTTFDIEHYILSNKNINLFKVIPWVSKDTIELPRFYKQEGPFSDIITNITAGISTVPGGFYNLLNKSYAWDAGNILRNEMFKGFFEQAVKGDFTFNPYTDSKTTLNIKTVDDYIKYRNEDKNDNPTDPVYQLYKLYEEQQRLYVHGDDTSQDWKVWLKKPRVLRTILDNPDMDIATLRNKVLQSYGAKIPDYQGYSYNNLSYEPSYGSTILPDFGNTFLSKATLDQIQGIEYVLVDESGKPYDGWEADVDKAITEVRKNKNFIADNLSLAFQSDSNYKQFVASDVLRLKAILGASDGFIAMRDLDELSRLDAEAYNEFFEKVMGKQGAGNEIRNKVLSLYQRYKGLIGLPESKVFNISKDFRLSQARTSGAATFSVPKSFTVNKLGNNENIYKQFNDAIIDSIEEPKADISRIQDLISDNTDDMYQNIYRGIDRNTSMYRNNPGSTESLVLSKDMNMSKLVSSINVSEANINKTLLDLGLDAMPIEQVTKLHMQADGTKFMSEWAKYALYDPESKNIVTTANIGRTSLGTKTTADLYREFSSQNLLGKVIFDLEKHSGRDSGGIKYGYMYLDTEKKVNEFKAAMLADVLHQRAYQIKNGIYDSSLSIKESNSDVLIELAVKALSEDMLVKYKNQSIINYFEESNIPKENLYKLLTDLNDFHYNNNKNTVNIMMGGKTNSLLDSDNPAERRRGEAMTFNMSYQLFDDENKKDYEKAQEILLDNHAKRFGVQDEDGNAVAFTEEQVRRIEAFERAVENNDIKTMTDIKNQLQSKEDIQDLIEGYLILSKKAETLHYLLNKDETLMDLHKIRHGETPVNSSYKLYESDTVVNQNELDLFFKYMDNPNAETRSSLKIKSLGGFDFETTNNHRATTIKDTFQIGLVSYNTDLNKFETKVYYILHEDLKPEEWVAKNINFDDEFYRNNPGYKEAVDTYRTYIKGDDRFITEEKLFELLDEHEMLIAFNGSNFDFDIVKPHLKQSMKYLDSVTVLGTKRLNVLNAMTNDAVYKEMLESPNYNQKSRFSQLNNLKAHDALEDTLMMMEAFEDAISTSNNFSKTKTNLLGKLEFLLSDMPVEEVISIYKDIDTNFKTGLDEIQNKFKQAPVSDDDMTYISRLFNHRYNNLGGRVLSDLIDLVNTNSVKNELAQNGEYRNIPKLIAYVSFSKGIDYTSALRLIQNNIYKITDARGTDAQLKIMAEINEDLLATIGLDKKSFEDIQSNPDYQRSLYTLQKDLAHGNQRMLDDSSLLHPDTKDTVEYISRGYLDSFVMDWQKALKEDSGMIEELKKLWEYKAVEPLTLKEGTTVEDIDKSLTNTKVYSSKQMQKLVEQLNTLVDDGTIATRRVQGTYNFMISFNTDQEYKDVEEIIYNKDGSKTTRSLKNISAKDIVITKEGLDTLLNGENIETLRASDGNLYVYSVAYPSDGMRYMAHRVRLVKDLGNHKYSDQQFGFTPATQALLRARDFDGDFLTTFKTSRQGVELASELTKYLLEPYEVIERLNTYLRKIHYGSEEVPNMEALKLSSDSKIVKYCNELEKVLTKHSNEEYMSEAMEEDIAEIEHKMFEYIQKTTEYSDSTIEEIVKYLGVQEKFEGTVRFVGNPLMWREGSESFRQRSKYFGTNSLIITNLADSIAGFNQKLWSKLPENNQEITAPLAQLTRPQVYLDDNVAGQIANKITDYAKAKDYLLTFKSYMEDSMSSLKKGVTRNNWQGMLDAWIDDALQKANTIEDLQGYLTSVTTQVLMNYETLIRSDITFNKHIKDKFLSNDDSSFLDTLKNKEQIKELVNNVKANKSGVYSKPMLNTRGRDLLFADMLNDYAKESSTKVTIDLDSTKGTVFLSKSGHESLLDNDSIGVSEATLSRAASLVHYDSSDVNVYQLKDLDKILDNISKGKTTFIPKGTVIGKHYSELTSEAIDIKASNDMDILDIKYVTDKDESGNDYKIITSILAAPQETLAQKKLKVGEFGKGISHVIEGTIEYETAAGKVYRFTQDLNSDRAKKGFLLTRIKTLKSKLKNTKLSPEETKAYKEELGNLQKSYDEIKAKPYSKKYLRYLNRTINNIKTNKDYKNKNYRKPAYGIDFYVSLKEAVKNPDKYGLSPDLKTQLEDMQEVTIVINGQAMTGYVVPRVKVFTIGDDTQYEKNVDVDEDVKYGKSTEIMALGSSGRDLFANAGLFGNLLLKNKDGKLVWDNSEVSSRFDNSDKDIQFKNTADLILATRANLLLNELSEEEFRGLFSGDMSLTKESYLDNLLNSEDKINSTQLAGEVLKMMMSLGEDRLDKVRNKSIISKAVFDSFYDKNVFYELVPTKGNPEVLEQVVRSKGSARTLKARNAEQSIGRIYNDAELDLRVGGMVQHEDYYIPYNWLYQSLFGRGPSEQALLKGTRNGLLNHSKHVLNGSDFYNRWAPVDSRHVTYRDGASASTIISNGKKTALTVGTDIIKHLPIPEKAVFGSGKQNVLNFYDSPAKQTIYSLLTELTSENSKGLGYDSSLVRIADYLYRMYDSKNNSILKKVASNSGTTDIQYSMLYPMYKNINGDLVQTHDIKTGTASIDNALRTIRKGSQGFWAYKDILDNLEKIDVTKQDIDNMKNSDVFKDSLELKDKVKEHEQDINKAISNLVTTLKTDYGSKELTSAPKINFTWDAKGTKEAFTDNIFSRSGIKIVGEDTMAYDVAIKNQTALAEYYKEAPMKALNNLKAELAYVNPKEFEDFAKYQWLHAAEKTNPEGLDARLNYVGITKSEYMSNEFNAKYNAFVNKHRTVVNAYNDYVNKVVELSDVAAEATGEPFDSAFIFLMPYTSKDPQLNKGAVISSIKSMTSLNKYDPIKKRDALEQNMMFNFFDGSEKIVRELSELASVKQISDTLINKGLIDNVSVIDKAFEIITKDLLADRIWLDKNLPEDIDITGDVLKIISSFTDLDYYTLSRLSKTDSELLVRAYNSLNTHVNTLREEYAMNSDEGEYPSFSQVCKDAETHPNYSVRQSAKELMNAMHGQIILCQRIMEVSPTAMNSMVKYIDSLTESGKVLTNKFGQRISMESKVRPLTSSSLAYLKENMEISLNNLSKEMFAQFVMEKALRGEIYVANKDLVDHLEKTKYTRKVPSKLMKFFTNVSKNSAAIQMAMPLKMLGRLFRFTAFDYTMGAMTNPEVLKYIPEAAKEISAAVHTQGKSLKDNPDLLGYFMREGQPLGYTSKDPINFSDELDMGSGLLENITKKLTRPLEIQNHLGRYAIYKTALENFRKGTPWYGVNYKDHEYIDSLGDAHEDKAMYVMDYLLGSPGGFPALSKKTSGLMMYSTFPMNLTRTLGAYGMSVAKLFQEGINAENSKQWMKTVVVPGAMTVGLSVLSSALLSLVCDIYDIDEETEEEWKKEGVTLDPIGTLIGETPSVVFDSVIPTYNLKEMYINPFTDKYNTTLPSKALGFVQANVLSRLNPVIKIPLEVVIRKDLYGATWGDTSEDIRGFTTKYQYTNIENGLRKVLGQFVGSGVADSVINQRKIDNYNEDSSFIGSIWKGIAKGINNDLGNQKSYKSDVSNYYAVLDSIKAFRNASESGNAWYNYDTEDLLDATALDYNRTYSNRYGVYNNEDFLRINSLMKRMIRDKENATTIYSLIVDEYNKGTSEATLRAVLNAHSIIRRLDKLQDKQAYYDTLSAKEKNRVQKAIAYEQEMYPLLSKFFPEEYSTNVYIPKYRKTYYSSGSKYPSTNYPSTYYPGKYYPDTFRYNKKLSRYINPNLDRVSVYVSPQMAVWNQDKNLTSNETGFKSENEPKWLRDKGYKSLVN